MEDFDYLKPSDIYLDAACQSLRPRPVIDALTKYYTEHNSCGERVKYAWGVKTDSRIAETREKVLKFLGLKGRRYTVSFTLNTTYGINLILNQLDARHFSKIMTSEIEHNSPFLATMAFSRRTGLPREIMRRNEDGSLPLSEYDFGKAIVVVNCASNFDGRKLLNIADLAKKVHQSGGILIIDAAQAAAHSVDTIRGVEVDAICFSAHKTYAPSLGVIAWRDDLGRFLEPQFIGGGMVDDVDRESYKLSSDSKEHRHTRFEPGLQAWGEIIGLGAALDWLEARTKQDWGHLAAYASELYDFLAASSKVHLVNHAPNPTMAFAVDTVDSHLLGAALSREGIMARTGYFCAHYYLDHVLHLPPLVRFSLGLHTRASDIAKVKEVLAKIIYQA